MSLITLNKFFRGIRFRLTVVYSTLFGLFICVFAYIVSYQFTQLVETDFDSTLLNYAIDLSHRLISHDMTFDSKLSAHEMEDKKHFPFTDKSSYFMLRNIKGHVIKKSHRNNIEIPYHQDLSKQKLYSHYFFSIKQGSETLRAVNLKIQNGKNDELILQVASPSSLLEEQKKTIGLINIITIPLLILISSLASYIIAGNALSPVKALTEGANNIAAKNLSLRVPVTMTGDEIEELSKTFNNLLDRLQKSFEAQDHFVANASHQLNTPLAIIKGELDVLESKQRTPEEQKKFLKSLREEIERLITLVKNMLLISRVEALETGLTLVPLDLDDVLLNTVKRLGPKARDKRISIRFNIHEDLFEAEKIKIRGERQLLESMFENLLDNAIKYSPERSSISLNLNGGPDFLEVLIQDEGPGIHPDDLEKILSNRYQRGTRHIMPGTGIGLSIAYKIAEHHGAQISYKKRDPVGSTFIVRIPV